MSGIVPQNDTPNNKAWDVKTQSGTIEDCTAWRCAKKQKLKTSDENQNLIHLNRMFWVSTYYLSYVINGKSPNLKLQDENTTFKWLTNEARS